MQTKTFALLHMQADIHSLFFSSLGRKKTIRYLFCHSLNALPIGRCKKALDLFFLCVRV